MRTAQRLSQQGAGQAVEQERRKEREKKISVKVRVARGEPQTAVAERLQRQSGRVVAEPRVVGIRGENRKREKQTSRGRQAVILPDGPEIQLTYKVEFGVKCCCKAFHVNSRYLDPEGI